jgi:acylphosphatase
MGQKRIHLVVRGRVQGVYFRATAQREARQHVNWSYAGPSTARVDAVDVRWRSYTGEYTDFRITR